MFIEVSEGEKGGDLRRTRGVVVGTKTNFEGIKMLIVATGDSIYEISSKIHGNKPNEMFHIIPRNHLTDPTPEHLQNIVRSFENSSPFRESFYNCGIFKDTNTKSEENKERLKWVGSTIENMETVFILSSSQRFDESIEEYEMKNCRYGLVLKVGRIPYENIIVATSDPYFSAEKSYPTETGDKNLKK